MKAFNAIFFAIVLGFFVSCNEKEQAASTEDGASEEVTMDAGATAEMSDSDEDVELDEDDIDEMSVEESAIEEEE